MALLLKMFNPSPYRITCAITMYPEECIRDDTVQCIRGSMLYHRIMSVISVWIYACFMLVFVIGSFTAIVIGACCSARHNHGSSITTTINHEQIRLKKSLIRQALMYQASFMIIWLMLLIRRYSYKSAENSVAGVIAATLLPLQGFFNALIFFYHKIYDIRRISGNEVGICQAFYYILCLSTHTNEVQLTGLTMIQNERTDHLANESESNDQANRGNEEGRDSANNPGASQGISFGPSKLDEDLELASSKSKPSKSPRSEKSKESKQTNEAHHGWSWMSRLSIQSPSLDEGISISEAGD